MANDLNKIHKQSIEHSLSYNPTSNFKEERHRLEHKLSSIDSAKQIHHLDKDDMLYKEKSEVTTSTYPIKTILRKLDFMVSEKEKHRNYKLISDFDREKTSLENEQAKIRHQIEDLAKMNINEQNINRIKEEKNKQQDLFNKYYKMNSETVQKINKYKENMPSIQEKIKDKQQKLKTINHENLELLEKIQEIKLKKIKEYKSKLASKEMNETSSKDNAIELREDHDHLGNGDTNGNNNMLLSRSIDKSALNVVNNQSVLMNSSKLNNSAFKYSEYGKDANLNKSVLNITEIIDENTYLKDKFSMLKTKNDDYKKIKEENKLLSNEISSINSQIFMLSKIFTEGMFEIGVELRKVHEIQLNKIINKKSYGNSLYFELVKDIFPSNLSGNCYPLSKEIKLPIIHDKIQKKYNFPLIEKSEPKTFIYNVIKSMIDEHQLLNRSINIKKRKFEWSEFSEFTAYQIYTILSLNREIIKELERRIFPKAISYLSVNSKNEFEKINEEDVGSDMEKDS